MEVEGGRGCGLIRLVCFFGCVQKNHGLKNHGSPILKMVHNPGGDDCILGGVDNPSYSTISKLF